MPKLRMLLVAVVAAMPLVPVAAQANHPECEGEGCPPDHCEPRVTCPFDTCRIDPPVEIGPDVIFFTDRPILDCNFV
jgi:hypothetical protein